MAIDNRFIFKKKIHDFIYFDQIGNNLHIKLKPPCIREPGLIFIGKSKPVYGRSTVVAV